MAVQTSYGTLMIGLKLLDIKSEQIKYIFFCSKVQKSQLKELRGKNDNHTNTLKFVVLVGIERLRREHLLKNK